MDIQDLEFKQDVFDAMQKYHLRKDRAEKPEGDFDKAGRWQPSAAERQDCCHKVRKPSKRYPFALLNHCRSIEHVARIAKVNYEELRNWIYIHTKGTKRLTGGKK